MCQDLMIDKCKGNDGSFDFTSCFTYLKPILENADLVLGNLETPISQSSPLRGDIITHDGPIYCNAPIEFLSSLKWAGFDMLTTANNHALDAGVLGACETAENIDNFDMIASGTRVYGNSDYVIVDVKGFRIGFASLTTTFNDANTNLSITGRKTILPKYSKSHAQDILDAMRRENVEYAICLPHWGHEYSHDLTATQIRMANDLAKMGYDAIIGTHQHVLQEFKMVDDTPVCFGLGNLISHIYDSNPDADTRYSAICKLNLKRNGESLDASFSFIPCRIEKDFQNAPFTTIPAFDTSVLNEDFPQKEYLDQIADKSADFLKVDLSEIEVQPNLQSATPEDSSLRSCESVNNENKPPSGKPFPEWVQEELSEKHEDFKPAIVNGNYYRVFKDHAELACINMTVPLFKIEKEVFGKPVTKINSHVNHDENLRLLIVSGNVINIEDSAFEGSIKLESIRMYSGLVKIGANAFANCVNMTGVAIPGGTLEIGPRCFQGCSKLRSVKIPKSVKTIGEEAFAGCQNLVIYGEAGSDANQYCTDHGIPFVSLSLPSGKIPHIDLPREKFVPEGYVSPPLGPHNGDEDPHPSPIRKACEALGKPLPEYAKCKYQPSYYLGDNAFDPRLENILSVLSLNPEDLPIEDLDYSYRRFVGKLQTQGTLLYSDTDLAVYFADYLLNCADLGFNHNCYFEYQLFNKEEDVRKTFISQGFRARIEKACCTPGKFDLIVNKAIFNKKFSRYVKRDWVDASNCTFEEFNAFVTKHPTFFVKPVNGTGGKGAKIINMKQDPKSLFKLCKDSSYICEEIIAQHESLSEFNSSSVNTVRVHTLLCADGVPRIVAAGARFGRKWKQADNFHQDGVMANVDIDTGIINTEAINIHHTRLPFHPDSGKMIMGFQYPSWDKVREAVLDASASLPEFRNVGWDLTVTEDGNVEFVEGNSRPNYGGQQSCDEIGRRPLFEPYIEEIEALKQTESNS